MPYIKEPQRQHIEPALDQLLRGIWETTVDAENEGAVSALDGILNYTISTIVADGINPGGKPWSYADIARAVAVFECAKLEFYRRVAGPKEDKAIEANGDIVSYSRLS